MNCIFCKIAGKEIVSKIISATDLSMAFLDINPASPGHALVISKSHFLDITDTPDDVLSDMISLAKKVAISQVQFFNATGFNILNASGKSAQQSVFHVHLHIVPRFDDDGKNLWFHGENNLDLNLESINMANEK